MDENVIIELDRQRTTITLASMKATARVGDFWLTDSPTQLFDMLTRGIIETEEQWFGWGYLGERLTVLSSGNHERVAEVDGELVAFAVANKWTVEELFTWANSGYGRHFADYVFGGDSFEATAGFGLLRKV